MRQSVFPVLHGASCVLIVWRNIVTGIVIRETSLSLVWRQGVLHQTSHGQHSFFSKCKWCGPYLIELCSFSKLIFLLKDHSDQPQTKFWFLRKHRGVQKIPGHRSSAQKKRLQRLWVPSDCTGLCSVLMSCFGGPEGCQASLYFLSRCLSQAGQQVCVGGRWRRDSPAGHTGRLLGDQNILPVY